MKKYSEIFLYMGYNIIFICVKSPLIVSLNKKEKKEKFFCFY